MKMKSLKILTLLLALISSRTSAQQLEWAHAFGTAGHDYMRNVNFDPWGNIITMGRFQDTLDIDPGPGEFLVTRGLNVLGRFIQKLDSNGNFIWGGHIGDPDGNTWTSNMVIDTEGNSILTFMMPLDTMISVYQDTLALHPNPNMGTEVFVCKIDPGGEILWIGRIGATIWCYENDLAVDSDGYIYLAGMFEGVADLDPGPGIMEYTMTGLQRDHFILKLDPNGNVSWVKVLAEYTSLSIGEMKLDPSGDLYMTGSFSGPVDLDPGPGSTIVSADTTNGTYLSKVDANGDLVWVRFPHYPITVLGPMAINSTGEIYWLHKILGAFDIDPGTDTLMSSTGNSYAIAKYDPNGMFINAVFVNSNWTPCRMRCTMDGGVVMAGNHLGLHFLPWDGTSIVPSSGDGDGFILEFTPDLQVAWVMNLTGPGSQWVRQFDIESNGYFVIGGHSNDVFDIDPSNGTMTIPHVSGVDAWLAKFAAPVITVGTSSDIATVPYHPPFPNPAQGHIYLPLQLDHTSSVRSQVFDGSGRCVKELTDATMMPGVHLLSLDIEDLIEGSYFIRVEVSGRVRYHKIIKMH